MSQPSVTRILLLTAGADEVEALQSVVDELDAELVVTPTAAEARGALGLPGLALAILDVREAGLEGLRIAQEIRSDAALASIAILLLDTRGTEEATLPGFDALATDVLLAPLFAREVRIRLRSLLASGRRARELDARVSLLDLALHATRLDAEGAGPGRGSERSIVSLLSRLARRLDAVGASLHVRRLDTLESRLLLSATWGDSGPPAFLAGLALSEELRLERPPRLPGLDDPSGDWTIATAPVLSGSQLVGTLRVYLRGPVEQAPSSLGADLSFVASALGTGLGPLLADLPVETV